MISTFLWQRNIHINYTKQCIYIYITYYIESLYIAIYTSMLYPQSQYIYTAEDTEVLILRVYKVCVVIHMLSSHCGPRNSRQVV